MKNNFSRTRSLLNRMVRYKEWSDFERLKGISDALYSSALKLFRLPQVKNSKSSQAAFKEAQAQYKLDEQQLYKAQKRLKYWAYVMVFFAISLLFVFIHYALLHEWKAVVLSLMGVGLALVLAFRYHFFAFEIQSKKLGCSFKEWFVFGLLGRKS